MTTGNDRITTVQALLDQRFGIRTETRDDPLVSQVETTLTQVLLPNPSRVGFTFVNLGANPIFLMSDAGVASTRGIRINATGGSAQVLFDEDFARVAYGWFAIATGGASACTLQEVLIGG